MNVQLFVFTDAKIVIRFVDSGKPYNLLNAAEPDFNTTLLERKIGGLGIHFVKNLMDNVEYEYAYNKISLPLLKSCRQIKPWGRENEQYVYNLIRDDGQRSTANRIFSNVAPR